MSMEDKEHEWKALTPEDVRKIQEVTQGKDPYPIVFAMWEKYRGDVTWYGRRINRRTAQWFCEALVVAWEHSLKSNARGEAAPNTK